MKEMDDHSPRPVQTGSAERSKKVFRKTTLWLAAATFPIVAIFVLSVAAQVSPDRADGGIPSNVSQGSRLTDVQAKLHASDEEWKVIGPKLRRVMAAYAAAGARIDESNAGGSGLAAVNAGGGSGGFAGGPRGGPGNDSFSGPGDVGSFGRGGPGFGGFGRGGLGPDGFSPEDFGRGGRGGPGFNGFGQDGFGRGGPGPGGGPPGFDGLGSNAVTQKLLELQTTLADPNATPEQLKEKIAAVRSARQKANAELEAARKDLLQLLTLDQEAILISFGYLD
jgi:hypothetical protein